MKIENLSWKGRIDFEILAIFGMILFGK